MTPEEIALLSGSLSVGKAVGKDGIPGEVLKYGSFLLYGWLSKFISQCFYMKYLPDLIMLVLLNPILKSKTGDHSLKSNYRPIAITSSVSKLVELVIKERIMTYLDTSDSQFGFKAKHGTDMAIYTLKMTLQYYITCNTPVFVCFLDASKAFDRINHVKLFEILQRRGLPAYIIAILSYWYQAQQYAVRWGDAISTSFSVSNGIRQGGILSPLIYNIYTDELNMKLNDCKVGCQMGGIFINHLSYADDMILLAPSVKALQLLVNTCYAYSVEHDILYNATKTVCMVFRPPWLRNNFVYPSVMLNERNLEYVVQYNYLGHKLCTDLNDDVDVGEQLRKLYTVGNVLIRKFKFCYDNVKCELFRAYCSTIYCSSLWCRFKKASMKKVKVCHNSILRRLLGIPLPYSASEMFVQHRLQNLDAIMRNAIFNLRSRLFNSENSLILAITSWSRYGENPLHRHWTGSLYVAV